MVKQMVVLDFQYEETRYPNNISRFDKKGHSPFLIFLKMTSKLKDYLIPMGISLGGVLGLFGSYYLASLLFLNKDMRIIFMMASNFAFIPVIFMGMLYPLFSGE